MADLPIDLRADLAEQLADVLDVEGKIPHALDALGQLAGSEVVLLDAASGLRARQLRALGARLTVLEQPARLGALRAALDDLAAVPGRRAAPLTVAPGQAEATGLPDASADAIVACWSAFHGPAPAALAEAERVLRPGGRLLVVHDYGRDDVEALRPDVQAERLAWSRRDGPFLAAGFKIRVLHCWWTFASLEEAAAFLGAAFGAVGEEVAARLRRPRLSYNVAVYHRRQPLLEDEVTTAPPGTAASATRSGPVASARSRQASAVAS
ncbi:MAG TPA: methyltransferase domain-containing protein [Candidatus Limnocylindrales bacterium]